MANVKLSSVVHKRLIAYAGYLTQKTQRRWTLADTIEKLLDENEPQEEQKEIPVPAEEKKECKKKG